MTFRKMWCRLIQSLRHLTFLQMEQFIEAFFVKKQLCVLFFIPHIVGEFGTFYSETSIKHDIQFSAVVIIYAQKVR